MAVDLNILSQFNEFVKKKKVKMKNEEMVESKWKGTMVIQTRKSIKYIKDDLLVPSLEWILLSIGQMIQNGYSLYFEDYICRIFHAL